MTAGGCHSCGAALASLKRSYTRAPLRLAEAEIARLARENQTLARQLEGATGWKGLARAKLQEYLDEGARIRQTVLEDVDESEETHQLLWSEFIKWRNEVLDYVHSLSPSKAAFLDEVKVVGTLLSKVIFRRPRTGR